MLAKLTSKNQVTLPKRAIEELGNPPYFDVRVEAGRMILSPRHPGAADAARQKLAALGISEADIADAVAWARRG